MKFGTLKSIGHNIADSLASGVGLMIGVYDIDVFGEAAGGPDGFIEVDFLTGQTAGAVPSPALRRAIVLYAEAFPELCKRHDVDASEFTKLSARFAGRYGAQGYTVTVADRRGRSSTDRYFGVPGKRPKILDHLGRVRGT